MMTQPSFSLPPESSVRASRAYHPWQVLALGFESVLFHPKMTPVPSHPEGIQAWQALGRTFWILASCLTVLQTMMTGDPLGAMGYLQGFLTGVGTLIQQSIWMVLWIALGCIALWLCGHQAMPASKHADAEVFAHTEELSGYEKLAYSFILPWGVWSTLNLLMTVPDTLSIIKGLFTCVKLVILWRIGTWGYYLLQQHYPEVNRRKLLALVGSLGLFPFFPWVPLMANWMGIGFILQLLK
ncbi:MAG: hypothetical protein ACKO37_01050 [Vampirovibrionales bacterium]